MGTISVTVGLDISGPVIFTFGNRVYVAGSGVILLCRHRYGIYHCAAVKISISINNFISFVDPLFFVSASARQFKSGIWSTVEV